MKETMTKPEILILMYALEALHETNNHEKALEVIKKTIVQVENKPQQDK